MGNTLKRTIGIILCVGLVYLVSVSSYKHEEAQLFEIPMEIEETELPEEVYANIEHDTLYSLQEEVRNEVFYGELEETALIVQAEAGNQDELGRRYVADVIFNRVDSSSFPDSVYDVIYQMDPIQFATTVDGTMGKAGYNIKEETFQIVLEEYENRTNSEIIYFRTEKYHECGTPAFKHGDHYFSTK